GRLEHPGIVPVYGMGRHPDGRPYYAMRLIRGQSLQKAVNEFHALPAADPARPLQMRKLLSAFVAVCNTMAFAPSRNCIHRDLKPDNIMLGPFGETLVVDWGLAKVRGNLEIDAGTADTVPEPGTAHPRDSSAEPTLVPTTGPGSLIGTPQFMSPEQAHGEA